MSTDISLTPLNYRLIQPSGFVGAERSFLRSGFLGGILQPFLASRTNEALSFNFDFKPTFTNPAVRNSEEIGLNELAWLEDDDEEVAQLLAVFEKLIESEIDGVSPLDETQLEEIRKLVDGVTL